MSSDKQVLWTTSASHALIHVYELSVPALLILIQTEFATGDFTMGRIVTLHGLMFGLGALPAGWLVDRFGSRFLLTTCLWGAALCMAGMAASPGLGWFAACAGLLGLSLSIYHPAGTTLVSHLPVSGRIFATHGMMGNLGVAGASAIAGSLGALFGWRWAIGLLSVLGVVLGLRVLTLRTAAAGEVRKREGRGYWPGYVTLILGMGFLGMVYRGMTTFLPKLLALQYGTDGEGSGTALGGVLTTLALLVGLLGMYVAGRAVDRGMSASRVFLVGTLVQTPFLVALAWAGGRGVLPLLMAVAFFHFFTQPPANYMVAEFVPPRLRGLGYGLYFFVSFGAGSFGATFGGWVSERAGLGMAFPALAVLLVPSIAAAVALGFTRLGRKPA